MIKDKDKSRIQSCVDHINTAVDVDPWAKELVVEMGKEVLKYAKDINVPNNDCISRQAAIGAICNACGKIDCDQMDTCEKIDIQPINSSEIPNSSDTISRQAAIALADSLKDNLPDDERIANCVIAHNEGILEYQTALSLLPFVQPERTCVNCGRTANNGGWYADGRTRCPIEEHYALPKDGYCHLWEKRNVTDDDYPERREE